MSLQDDLTAVKRCLDALTRSVGQLERDLARQRRGTEHPPDAAPGRPEGLVPLSGVPYDASTRRESGDRDPGTPRRGAS
ncbi:hypothetical protein ACE14D_25415 [Streptomyces sp. Act-28]